MYRKKATFLLILLAAISLNLISKTIRVPEDFLTIKSAVKNGQNGDIIEVGDGYYFEKNIIIDKEVQLRAKSPYGAIVYGSRESGDCIFVVRAKTEISGFILKNSFLGICQRDSPDVVWRGRDLAFFNITAAAIEINDRHGNAGSALLEHLIIDNCRAGVCTNDAREVTVEDSLIANCQDAFGGSNHLSFIVKRTIVWNCQRSRSQSRSFMSHFKNQIIFSADVLILDDPDFQRKEFDIYRLAKSYLAIQDSSTSRKKNRSETLDGLIGNIIGRTFLKKRDYISSRKCFLMAEKAGRVSGHREISFDALFGLAIVSERTAEPSLAIKYFKKTMTEIDGIITGLPLRLYWDSFFEDKIEVYELAIHLLYLMSRKDPRPEYAEDAFFLAEKSRAAGIYNVLRESPAKRAQVADSVYTEKNREIQKKISLLQRALYSRKKSPEESRAILEKLEESEDEYRAFFMRMSSANKHRPNAEFSDILLAASRDRILISGDVALLEYFIGNRYGFAFLQTRDSLGMIALSNAFEFDLLVANYLSFLSLESSKVFLGEKGGRVLYDRLIGPFKEKLSPNIRKLVIIPDGILHYLPFETLISDATNRRGDLDAQKGYRFLIEDYEISYSPSAVCSAYFEERDGVDGKSMDIMAIACPKANYQLDGHNNSGQGFRRLAFVQKETLAVAKFFPKERQKLLTGKRASEEEIKSLELSNFKILHFAAHGVFDDQFWWRSGILLNRDEEGFEDGLFQPIDLFGMRLDADLVVLSCCQSGSGHLEKGEGLIGFSTAFFLAGANSILSSLWAIEDESAAQFMNRFYLHLAAGKTKGEALKFSKVDMIHSKFGHPFFWASFILIGDHASKLHRLPSNQ